MTPIAPPIVIVGAGPVGLCLAIDLAMQGVASTVLDRGTGSLEGSRAICWAKRTLEIFDRLGIGQRVLDKGVTWKTGRVFHGADEIWNFDLLPEDGHRMPAFVNLQQPYVERFLAERAAEFPDLIDIRWRSTVTDHEAHEDGVRLCVDGPDGTYDLHAGWMVAADGSRSPIRERMGLRFEGLTFEERFLIADVKMPSPPFESGEPERWFWFKPPFHPGQSALLHQQPDDIYRIDLQLGADADPEEEKKPERVVPRIRQMVGDHPFELDWVSVYRFRCARLDRFVHGRVVFAGDSAHVVSPFGARGGNGGVQDADNLAWKLAAVVQGEADASLMDTYDVERGHAADENIANSARATGFMTPKNRHERLFRDAVLDLAHDHPFARRMVNSGRLSKPASFAGLPGFERADGPLQPGEPCVDAPTSRGWLLEHLGTENVVLSIGEAARGTSSDLHVALGDETPREGDLVDVEGFVERRYGRNRTYRIRPDQHVADVQAARVRAA